MNLTITARVKRYCPVCGRGRVIDTVSGDGIPPILLLGPEREKEALLFVKCPKCGKQIGVAISKTA